MNQTDDHKCQQMNVSIVQEHGEEEDKEYDGWIMLLQTQKIM